MLIRPFLFETLFSSAFAPYVRPLAPYAEALVTLPHSGLEKRTPPFPECFACSPLPLVSLLIELLVPFGPVLEVLSGKVFGLSC